jgi:hypothetical protein
MTCNLGHQITFIYNANSIEWYCQCSKGSRYLPAHREDQETLAFNTQHPYSAIQRNTGDKTYGKGSKDRTTARQQRHNRLLTVPKATNRV